jgi:hypothetical protein
MTTTMTSIKKRTPEQAYEDDTLGPRARHPSGTVYPNLIFSHEHDEVAVARFYQDMIRYSISHQYREKIQKQKEEGQPNGFKIYDIGDWLINHNLDYIDYYSGSKSRTPRKKNNIYKRVARYLENLEKWLIVKKLQQVDADTRNGTKPWLYGYGRVGNIIAYIFEYRESCEKSDYNTRQQAKNEIFSLIQSMFKDPRIYKSYKEDFLAKFCSKLMEYDNNNNDQLSLCHSVIRQIIAAFEDQSITHDTAFDYLDHVLQTIPLTPLGDLQTKQTILRRLYLQTLNELPQDTRRKVMYHDKDFLESKMLMSQPPPPKDWSDIREQYKNNYDTIVLCGTCKNKDCSHYNRYGTVICDYYDYISTMRSLSADNSYSQMDCPDCNAQKSIYVYNTMNNLRNAITNNSF